MAVSILIAIIDVYRMVVIVRILFSWLPARHRATQIYEFLFAITEPVMKPFRKFIPAMGGFDLSPIALLIILSLIQGMFVRM